VTDEVFRMVVAGGVALAGLSMIVQAVVVFALFRAVRKTQQKVEPLMESAGPVIGKVGPVIDSVKAMVEKTGPIIEKVGPVLQRIGPIADRTSEVIGSANHILTDARPRVAEIATDVAAITRSGKEQVERIGELVHTAGEKARDRLEQIDHAVSDTVEHVEHVGGSVKRAVLRPVREVNGIAAGISAAVSTLVKGQRKSSVDVATQDEELFI
jgi:methyl-accepting chemotaxis protein